jgi:dihydropteroate synthase
LPPHPVAFSDMGLALGALALGSSIHDGPWSAPGAAWHVPGAVETFLVPAATPTALWRDLASASRAARVGSGTVFAVARDVLDRRAGDDPIVAALTAAAAARRAVPPRVRVMGIVNVTPDSFSDGGRFLAPERAVEHGLALAAAGADLLDVGGESTRPGAVPVSLECELARVLPVIEALVRAGAPPISIDTTKAEVARAAVAAGATLVNDVSAGEVDPAMAATVAALGVDYVAMHRQGTPATMQANPTYGDAVLDVANDLRRRVRAFLDAGVAAPRITLDPGLGFGKRLPHNLALLARLGELRSLGLPLLVGPSRKSFIAHVLDAEKGAGRVSERRDDRGPDQRSGGTAAAVALSIAGGASIVRVHDVHIMYEATRVAEAIASAPAP